MSTIRNDVLYGWTINVTTTSIESYLSPDEDCSITLTSPAKVRVEGPAEGDIADVPAHTIVLPIAGGHVRSALAAMLAGTAPLPSQNGD